MPCFKAWGVDCQDDIDRGKGRSPEINDMDNEGTGMQDVRRDRNSRNILGGAEHRAQGWIRK